MEDEDQPIFEGSLEKPHMDETIGKLGLVAFVQISWYLGLSDWSVNPSEIGRGSGHWAGATLTSAWMVG